MIGVFDQVQKIFWCYGFLSLMWCVDVQFCDILVGSIWQLWMEKFCLGQMLMMIFVLWEIVQVSWQDGCLYLSLYSFGLWGLNGLLLLYYIELVLNCLESCYDLMLVYFFNIFYYCWLMQFWQVWYSVQFVGGGLDKLEYDCFVFYIVSFSGQDLWESVESLLLDYVCLVVFVYLVCELCNFDGLVVMLVYYFSVFFVVKEFVLYWIMVVNDEIICLGMFVQFLVLGNGVFIGQVVLDMQYKFWLIIGLFMLKDYLCFLFGGNNLFVLIELVCMFIGFEYCWEIELQLKFYVVLFVVIGGVQWFGWMVWVGKVMYDCQVIGMIFEFEYGLIY